MHVEETKPVPEEVHWFVEVTAGVHHIWNTIVLRQMVIAGGITLLVVGFLESICFAVVSQGLHRPPTFLGVVIAVQGVGAVFGGPTASPIQKRIGEGPLMGLGLILLAIGAGLLTIQNLPGVLAGAICLGAGLPWIVVAAYTMLQRRTPLELQGRVSAAADTILSTPQILSIALGAELVGIVDYRILLAIMAGTVLVAAAYLMSRPEQWVKLPPGGEEDPPADAPAAEPSAPGANGPRAEPSPPGGRRPGQDREAAILEPSERVARVHAPEEPTALLGPGERFG